MKYLLQAMHACEFDLHISAIAVSMPYFAFQEIVGTVYSISVLSDFDMQLFQDHDAEACPGFAKEYECFLLVKALRAAMNAAT